MPDLPKPKVRKQPPPRGRTQRHEDKRRKPAPEPIMGICDRCAKSAPADELLNGPEGTEWDGCAICNDCFVEI